uniref:Uncharacterized protein n=1 Tax=Anguilla anguilla TaxID=7936 RepID=A0A0E9VHY6_ANGAN
MLPVWVWILVTQWQFQMGVGSLKVKCQSRFILFFIFYFTGFICSVSKGLTFVHSLPPPVKLTHNLCTFTGL